MSNEGQHSYEEHIAEEASLTKKQRREFRKEEEFARRALQKTKVRRDKASMALIVAIVLDEDVGDEHPFCASNKNLAILPSPKKARVAKNILVMIIAENIETMTPMPSVSAKPLISDVPNQKRIREVRRLEVLESRIESQAREKPSPTASLIV